MLDAVPIDDAKALVGAGVGLLACIASAAVCIARLTGLRRGALAPWCGLLILTAFMALWRLIGGDTQMRVYMKYFAGNAYDDRRRFQAALLVACATVAVGLVIWSWKKIGAWPQIDRIAAALGTMLTGFVFIRAVSFHPIDAVIYHRIAMLSLNRVLELLSYAAIMAAAIIALSGRTIGALRS